MALEDVDRCFPVVSIGEVALLLVVRGLPSFVRVVQLHFVDDRKGIRSQVLLVHHAVVADYERHHARNTILGRNSDECKTTDHRSANHVVNLSEACSRALTLQNFEMVTMEGLLLIDITFRERLGRRLSDRTSPASVSVLPGQAILFAGGTNNSLRVLIHSGVIVNLFGIGLLGFHVSTANCDSS